MIELLIFLIILGLVAWLVRYLPIPEPWSTVIIIVLVVIAIVYLLRMIGGGPELGMIGMIPELGHG